MPILINRFTPQMSDDLATAYAETQNELQTVHLKMQSSIERVPIKLFPLLRTRLFSSETCAHTIDSETTSHELDSDDDPTGSRRGKITECDTLEDTSVNCDEIAQCDTIVQKSSAIEQAEVGKPTVFAGEDGRGVNGVMTPLGCVMEVDHVPCESLGPSTEVQLQHVQEQVLQLQQVARQVARSITEDVGVGMLVLASGSFFSF